METTTKLPLAIKNLYDNHIMGMIKVVDWIEETLQIKIDYKHHILKTTCVDFHMRHDNDYIEMGPHTDDPEGKLFHFYSSQDVEIPVPIDRLGEVLAEINEHQSIGKKRIADNVEIYTDVSNQFILQKRMEINYGFEKADLHIEFRIHHVWQHL